MKNWKTTAAGGAGVLMALADILTQLSGGPFDSTHLLADITSIITAVGLMFAKDSNVTGGNVRQ